LNHIRTLSLSVAADSLSAGRNNVIDQLMSIKDAEFLRALSDMIDRAQVQENAIQLIEEQKTMLAMSEEYIQAGRTIDQFTLNERELEWLKRK
jgi:hypothetical protein